MNYKKLLVYAPTKAIFEQALANSIADQNSVAYIEEPRMIWAQGNYYPCPYTKEEIDQLVQNNKDEFERIITELKGNVTEEYNTLEKIENKIKEEVLRAQQKESELDTKIEAETNRAQEAENNLDQKLDQEIERAKSAESTLNQQITNEVNRAKEAEQTLTEGLNDANESIQDVRDTYLPLAGGTMTGSITFGSDIPSIIVSGKTSTDLLNAAGSTTRVDDIISQVDLSKYLIKGNNTLELGEEVSFSINGNRNLHYDFNSAGSSMTGSGLGVLTLTPEKINFLSSNEHPHNQVELGMWEDIDDTIDSDNTLVKGMRINDGTNSNNYSAIYSQNGVYLRNKTSNDLLTANGSTTVLKTIGGESLLGEGNIELATNADIDALFGVIDTGDE